MLSDILSQGNVLALFPASAQISTSNRSFSGDFASTCLRMPQQTEAEDVIVVGWLRGDDYEAALAYRRLDDEEARSDAETPEAS